MTQICDLGKSGPNFSWGPPDQILDPLEILDLLFEHLHNLWLKSIEKIRNPNQKITVIYKNCIFKNLSLNIIIYYHHLM